MNNLKKAIILCIFLGMIIGNTTLCFAVPLDVDVDTVKSNIQDMDTISLIEADVSMKVIDISDYLKTKAQASLGKNPNSQATNTLTAQNPQDFLLFSITSDKYMFARIDSKNVNYEAVICFADFETGTVTPTNVRQKANTTFSLNNLPQGDYAVWIHSTDNSFDSSYNFLINAKNPSGDAKYITSKLDDIKNVGLQYADGSIYANGNYICNISDVGTNVGDLFNWERTHDFQTGTDYSYRQLKVSNVIPMAVVGPTYYESAYASSDSVMIIYCDVGTTWQFTESKPFTLVDVFGRKTPRQLDELDVYSFQLHDRYHILAYDVEQGKAIDFFSPLNYYYFYGLEDWPVNGITKGFRPAP